MNSFITAKGEIRPVQIDPVVDYDLVKTVLRGAEKYCLNLR